MTITTYLYIAQILVLSKRKTDIEDPGVYSDPVVLGQ